MLRSTSLRFAVLFALLMLSGCAGQPKPPIGGRSFALFQLPFDGNAADARQAISKSVEPLMYDNAARSYRDSQLASINDDIVQDYPDNEQSRIRIAQLLVEGELRRAVTENRALFRMTRTLPDYSRAGNINQYNLGPKPDAVAGSFSGTYEIGTKFNHHYQNSVTHKKESYLLGLKGGWNVGASSLECTYSIAQASHSSAIGLSSQLSLASLTPDLSQIAQKAIDRAKKEAESMYNGVVKSASEKIRHHLKARVVVGTELKENIGESTFDVNFETAIARLQRRLDKFKYDKDNSTFVFELSEPKSWFGKDVLEKVSLIIKLFPERSRTVAVYRLDFQPVVDSLTDNKLFTQADVRSLVVDHINVVEDLLKK